MTTPTPILSVSQLNRQVRSWLEHEMGTVNVEGEISNLSKPASGHFYFTLKDESAQIRCVYFRNRHAEPDFIRLENGQQVLISGILSLYEARGDYQLIIEQLSRAGEGNLYRQFELLKIKLAALGLFNAPRKKTLPLFPKYIGIVTSTSGAALRDILITLKRRYPVAPLLVFASDVQGKLAAQQLIMAIHRAHQDGRPDVLILARGGGSIEDLWAFNDEQLAHAIAQSTIPIVSGIGHETDFTIADFVADVRAATPTAAAETVSPNGPDLIALIKGYETELLSRITRIIRHQTLLLQHETHKLSSPKQLIRTHWQSLDFLRSQLQHAALHLLTQKRHELHQTEGRLDTKNPALLVQQSIQQVQHLQHNMTKLLRFKLNHIKQNFTHQLATLHAVSPLATLDRGYAIATFNQHVLSSSKDVKPGDVIEVRLAKGYLTSKITHID